MDTQNINIGMGAVESPEDLRDWTLASVGASEIYPTSCFLDTDWMVPSNQGKIGSCVGCTGEEMVRQIVYLTKGNTPPEELSFRFVYALAKCLEGKPGYEMYSPCAEGTYPALVAKIIRKFGVPLAKYCPNDISLDHESFVFHRNENNIPAEVFIDAMSRTSGADFSVPCTEDGIKQALNFAQANKGGVMILRRIGDTYWKDKNGISTYKKEELLPIRVPTKIVSGHEEFLTGYDYESGTNRMRIYWLNHWSSAWADNGRGWEYFDVWQSLIKEIRVVVAEVPAVDDFKYTFTKVMKKGDKGADVVALQHVLKLEGLFPKLQAFTGSFGPLTQTGVTALQNKYASKILTPAGLTSPTGVVGQFTLAWLNKHYGK
jgi:hypothetical protein